MPRYLSREATVDVRAGAEFAACWLDVPQVEVA
jgi:hypothetical protein